MSTPIVRHRTLACFVRRGARAHMRRRPCDRIGTPYQRSSPVLAADRHQINPWHADAGVERKRDTAARVADARAGGFERRAGGSGSCCRHGRVQGASAATSADPGEAIDTQCTARGDGGMQRPWHVTTRHVRSKICFYRFEFIHKMNLPGRTAGAESRSNVNSIRGTNGRTRPRRDMVRVVGLVYRKNLWRNNVSQWSGAGGSFRERARPRHSAILNRVGQSGVRSGSLGRECAPGRPPRAMSHGEITREDLST